MIENYNETVNDRFDLALITIRLSIKDNDLENFLFLLNHFNLEPSVLGNYFIRYGRRHKAYKIIRFMAKLYIVQEKMNMTEEELLAKYLYQ